MNCPKCAQSKTRKASKTLIDPSTPILNEEQVYYKLFDLQYEFFEFVENNYQKWAMPQKHKDRLSKMFWDKHKLEITQIVFDDMGY
jgi:hypothetical protein